MRLIAESPGYLGWQRELAVGAEYLLGREFLPPTASESNSPQPPLTEDHMLAAPWERCMSRRQAILRVNQNTVAIDRVPESTNPLFCDGEPSDHLHLRCGEAFVVGQTVFRLEDSAPSFSSAEQKPLEEIAFTSQQLRQVPFADADRRLDVLSRFPELIREAHNDAEFHTRLVNLLLAGVRHAEAAAAVTLDNQGQVELSHWERRRETAGVVRPSARLVTEAIHRRKTVLHVWESTPERHSDYTASGEFDWAFCTPVAGRSGRRGALYLAGRVETPYASGGTVSTSGLNLQADMKFVELVAEIISSVERLKNVEGHLSVLRQFLSPPILAALERTGDGGGLDTDLLEPKECDVVVLFCDVRGFSHRAEESAGDLRGLLSRVSAALEVMTQQILGHGGVTGDFQGDAVLGFWGWPFASEEASLNACRAALGIRRAFEATRNTAGHPLADFSVGIGVAFGRAVAGKIGTSDRVTVTVFGPVVNLASRLEGMTKQLHVPILLDEIMTDVVRSRFEPSEARVRRLAKVLPYGMETPLVVGELLPPYETDDDLTSEQLATYEQGVDHFIAGRWEQAHACLHAMPSSDRAQDFLTVRITQHRRVAPPGWNGVIELPK